METPEETGRKMDALGLWDELKACNFAIKPKGSAFPYFCTALGDSGNAVKVHFMMMEGWQTFHSFLIARADPNFGTYSTPMEMPHFELVVAADGSVSVSRHDPCYMPRQLKDSERTLVSKILWEAYGVLLRLESDKSLPMRFAGEKAMFSRIETSPGKWEDAPLSIPNPPPYVEKISIPKDLAKKAKDMPFDPGASMEIGFRLVPGWMTREARPRCCYRLLALDASAGQVVNDLLSANPDGGLKAMWTGLASVVLRKLVERGRVPGEVKVSSGRLFRMLRPLCMELPFKLSMHDSLPELEAEFKRLEASHDM